MEQILTSLASRENSTGRIRLMGIVARLAAQNHESRLLVIAEHVSKIALARNPETLNALTESLYNINKQVPGMDDDMLTMLVENAMAQEAPAALHTAQTLGELAQKNEKTA